VSNEQQTPIAGCTASRHHAPAVLLTAKNPDLHAVLVLSLLWVLFFWRLLTPVAADRVVFQEGDFTRHYYAFASYQAERLAEGQLPLWDPYNHAGSPFAANVQWGMWNPIRWLMVWTVGRDGFSVEEYQIEVALHLLIASLLAYLFLRQLTARAGAAFVGSLLFAYGGYMTGYPILQPGILEAAAWLPLVLLGAHLSVYRPRWQLIGVALAGVALAISLFAGHPQTTLYIGYLALAYLVFAGWSAKLAWWKIGLRAVLMVGVGLGLSAVQILPAQELVRLSTRVEYNFLDKAGGHEPQEILTMLWPQIGGMWSPQYLGVAGLLLAGGAALRRNSVHYFWIGAGIVALVLSLGGHGIVFPFFYLAVPGFNIFRSQERAIMIFTMAAVVLATLQLDWLLSRAGSTTEASAEQGMNRLAAGHLLLAGIALLSAAVIQFAFQQPIPVNTMNTLALVALLSLLFYGWYRLRRDPSVTSGWAVGLLAALVVVDLFTVGIQSSSYQQDTPENRVMTPQSIEVYRPSGQITYHIDGAAGLLGYGEYFRVPDIYGTGPFELDSIHQLRMIPVDRFWEVLAVRYAMLADVAPPAATPTAPMATFMNENNQPYVLYELTAPRPFAYLVYDYRVANNAEFARQMMADSRVNLREVGITGTALPFDLPGSRPADSKIDGFQVVTPEHMTMSVSTGENALLTLAIPDYPGWQATVDGRPVAIVDTYAGLIGIPIEAGDNQIVSVDFVPGTVIVGGIISAMTLLAVMIIVVLAAVHSSRAAGQRADNN
jgi:hypothetical protein